MPYIKIDKDGHYRPFPGITIVASTRKEDSALWNRVYASIKDLNRDYFSALPPSSYHMTTTNLYTASQFPETVGWDNFLKMNLLYFQGLHTHLSQEQSTFNVMFDAVFTNGVIQLLVVIPEEQKAKINQFASAHGLDSRLVPSYFHITLAYQYKQIPSEKEYHRISNSFQTALKEIFEESPFFKLQPAELNYFLDMSEFHAWDGQNNPFHSSATSHTPTS